MTDRPASLLCLALFFFEKKKTEEQGVLRRLSVHLLRPDKTRPGHGACLDERHDRFRHAIYDPVHEGVWKQGRKALGRAQGGA